MSGETRFNEFLQAVQDWKSSKYLVEVKPPEEASIALNADFDTIKSWNAETCNMYAFKFLMRII